MAPLIWLGWEMNAFSVVQMGSERKKFKESVTWATVFFLLALYVKVNRTFLL